MLASPMTALCLVHLLWGPFGPPAAARFGAAYRGVDPGVEHRFVAVYNGFRGDVSAVRDALGVQADHEVHIDGRVQDLVAYRRALDDVGDARVAFVNGWAEPLVDGWLAMLAGALDADGVGIAGCTASWESPATAAPPHLKLHRRRLFEPFPNPHVRTNAWAIGARLARSLVWDVRRRKVGAESLESGRQGITRQVQAQGLRPVMVSRHGAVEVGDWPEARVFRSGAQEELLVRDNRTRQYDDADPRRKAFLARMAWGDRAVVGA
jgi:hypothetical protein